VRQASREQQSAARIAERLRERQDEIERATLTRVHAVSKPPPRGGPEYVEGLRAAVSAGVDYGLAGIERGEVSAPPIPAVLLGQARLAARSGVSLDTVLRRYFAGHTLLEDFLMQETEREGVEGANLKRLLRSQAALVDRLLAAVSEAHIEEAERRPRDAERRKAEWVERLLDGEPLETSELAYDFEGWHLGLVGSGVGAAQAISALARSLDRRLLSVRREEGMVWAWLGSKRRLCPDELEGIAADELPADISLAIGEPGEGAAGWRLTHRQARAALPVALRGRDAFVRYADVALLASILQDDLLTASLRELFLRPLEAERDGGETLRQTLSAYFASERNASSAAAMLGVNRQTVTRRLATIERRLGRSLRACAVELEAALRLRNQSSRPS
jgi:PucR C-terminal helix-turn-helix domain/GGDEF-like domain